MSGPGACCDSCAQGGPCASGGCATAALAPVRSTAAGQGLAYFLGGDGGPRLLTIDCGGVAVKMLVEHLPGGRAVRLTGQANWGDGRWARASFEVDTQSFHEGCAVADAHGGLPRLAAMVDRAAGRMLSVGLDERPILGRGY